MLRKIETLIYNSWASLSCGPAWFLFYLTVLWNNFWEKSVGGELSIKKTHSKKTELFSSNFLFVVVFKGLYHQIFTVSFFFKQGFKEALWVLILCMSNNWRWPFPYLMKMADLFSCFVHLVLPCSLYFPRTCWYFPDQFCVISCCVT